MPASAAADDAASLRTEVRVMFFDTDAAAIVHNIAYLRFIEVARTLLGEKLGLTMPEMLRTNRFAVVTRTEIDYLRPARLGDTLAIHGRLESLERIRFWCAFEVHRPADGTLIARARQALVLVQMPSGRPQPLPAAWPAQFPELISTRASPAATDRTAPAAR